MKSGAYDGSNECGALQTEALIGREAVVRIKRSERRQMGLTTV